jgi:threonine/homoserine/homoserine lactone efflux protein
MSTGTIAGTPGSAGMIRVTHSMPEFATYVTFLIAVLGYQLSGIGPDMLLVISRGIGQGWKAALATAIGCVSAGFVQIPLLALGLASLVTSSPFLYRALQLTGAAYLIFVGAKFLLASRRSQKEAAVGPAADTGLVSAFRQGLICNLTNPTTLAFMLAILPQFVHPSEGPAALQFLIFGATMKATGLAILGGVALTSGAAGNWLARSRTFLAWQQRFAGTIMIGLGIRMLFAAASGSGAETLSRPTLWYYDTAYLKH